MNTRTISSLLSLAVLAATFGASNASAQEATPDDQVERSHVEVLVDLSNAGFALSSAGGLAATSLGIAIPVGVYLHLEAQFSGSLGTHRQEGGERMSSWIVGPSLGLRFNLAQPGDAVRPFIRLRGGAGVGEFFESRFWSISGRASVGASVRLHRYLALQPELGVAVAYADQSDSTSFSAAIHYGLGIAFRI